MIESDTPFRAGWYLGDFSVTEPSEQVSIWRSISYHIRSRLRILTVLM